LDARKDFERATLPEKTAVKSQKRSQKTYIDSVDINEDNKVAVVKGIQVLEVQNVRAVLPRTYRIELQYGNRTKENPFGIFVAREDVLSPTDQKQGAE
jgi:hypothetical protein